MVELIKLWIAEVNRKKALRSLLKELRFSFAIKIDQAIVPLTIKNGHIKLNEDMDQNIASPKKLEGEEETFLSILLGEQKLRDAVNNKEVTSTFSYRELLLLESLFFLAKPNLLSKFLAKPSYF